MPKSNEHDGNLSEKAQKRLRKAVSWMDALNPWRWEKNPTTGKNFRFKLNFITLTLPAPQMHSDLVIKSRALHPFITHMVKRFGLRQYVWRAEAQENGNIHFHFVTNKFMNLFVVRRAWNLRMKKLGYIQKYREAQQAFHANGFQLRKEALKFWSAEAQEKAYRYGIETNWSDPNTTDIHSLSNVKNVAAYIGKYMTKTVKGTCPCCKKSFHFKAVPEQQPVCNTCSEPLSLSTARSIEGRLWFISRALSNIKAPRVDIDENLEAELFIANGYKFDCLTPSPYASVYLLRPENFPRFKQCVIAELWRDFCTRTLQEIEKMPLPVIVRRIKQNSAELVT